MFTNQEQIEGVANILGHENWGRIDIKCKADTDALIKAAKRSLQLMREAVSKGISTGWYALARRA
jgi:uncharacterized protein